MLDATPALKRRTMGLAALAAIGLGGAVAVDLIVTGGFDFAPGRAPYGREQPSAYVRVVDAANYVNDSFRSMGWDQSYFLRPPDTSASEERLAGEDDGSMPESAFGEGAGDDLYEEIAALYAESEPLVEEPAYDEPGYEDALALDEMEAAHVYEDEVHQEDYAAMSEKEAAIAYESE